MNDLLDLDLRPWKSFDNVSNVADQQFEHLSDNLEVERTCTILNLIIAATALLSLKKKINIDTILF